MRTLTRSPTNVPNNMLPTCCKNEKKNSKKSVRQGCAFYLMQANSIKKNWNHRSGFNQPRCLVLFIHSPGTRSFFHLLRDLCNGLYDYRNIRWRRDKNNQAKHNTERRDIYRRNYSRCSYRKFNHHNLGLAGHTWKRSTKAPSTKSIIDLNPMCVCRIFLILELSLLLSLVSLICSLLDLSLNYITI